MKAIKICEWLLVFRWNNVVAAIAFPAAQAVYEPARDNRRYCRRRRESVSLPAAENFFSRMPVVFDSVAHFR